MSSCMLSSSGSTEYCMLKVNDHVLYIILNGLVMALIAVTITFVYMLAIIWAVDLRISSSL